MVSIDEVLTECGWGEGFHVPVANEENRLLEEEIDEKTKRRTWLISELETLTRRVDTLKTHARNVILMQEHNQKLLTAHSMQLDNEDHLLRLAIGKNSKLNQEIRELRKEKKDINERSSMRENDLDKLRGVLESLKKTAKFDKDQLLEWEEALRRGKEDNELIEFYVKTDSKKFKDLDLKRQKLCDELTNWRQTVATSVNEVLELEQILDRTAMMYDKALKERQQLINQWTQSVLVLKQRDNEIHKAIRETDQLREIGKEKLEVLQECEEFLRKQKSSNKEIDERIKQLERKLSVIKNEHSNILGTIATYSSEVHAQTKVLASLGRRTEVLRAEKKQLKIEVENKAEKLKKWKEQLEELKTTLREIDNQRTNVADRTKQLESMIAKEEKLQKCIGREIDRLQGSTERTKQRIVDLEAELKFSESEIRGEEKKLESLNNYQKKERKKLMEKREIESHLNYQIQKCDIKLRRLTGNEIDEEEAEKKNRALRDLEKVLSEKNEIFKLLQSQITLLEHDMRKLTNCISNDEIELNNLKDKKQNQVLLLEGGEKQLKAIKSRNDDKQVNENILRLRISQAEQNVCNVDNKVYDLEKHELELQARLEERKAEIKREKDSLNINKRVAAAEVLELRMAIAERKNRIRQLKTRYDNVMACMGTTPDGSPLTTTYMKIKSAQEKYALQEQGDKLDELIRKTECEIESMENTLRIVNASNDKYKKSLGLVEENDPEDIEQKKLDEEMYVALENLRQKRQQFSQTKSNLKLMEDQNEQLLREIETVAEEVAEKQRYLQVLRRQIDEQRRKQARADKSLQAVYKEVQNMCDCTDDNSLLSLQEKDIAIRNLQEQNGLALQHITELTARHVEVEPYIKKLLANKNMTLPCTNHLRPLPLLSRCESTASSSRTKCSLSKNSSRTTRSNINQSTAESVSSILNIEPCFDGLSTGRSISRSTDLNSWNKRPAPCHSRASAASNKSGSTTKNYKINTNNRNAR